MLGIYTNIGGREYSLFLDIPFMEEKRIAIENGYIRIYKPEYPKYCQAGQWTEKHYVFGTDGSEWPPYWEPCDNPLARLNIHIDEYFRRISKKVERIIEYTPASGITHLDVVSDWVTLARF